MHPNSNQISCSPASPLDAGLVLLLLRCGSGAAGAVPGQKTPGKASWVGSGCRVAGCWEHLEVLSWGKKGLGAGALGCTSQIHPARGQGWQVLGPAQRAEPSITQRNAARGVLAPVFIQTLENGATPKAAGSRAQSPPQERLLLKSN